jgi:hypothetical protein
MNMLKTEKQTIMEFLGKTDVKKKFMNVLAEKLRKEGHSVAIIEDCKESLPEELKKCEDLEAVNLWIHFQIQSEIILALSAGVEYILIERGIKQTKLEFDELLKNGKISQEKRDNFKRLILREFKSDKVIDLEKQKNG